MTVSLHCSAILGPGDSARLRTEIGEVSVAREAFAGVPAGEHEGDFVIRRLCLKAATGDSYVLVLRWADLADHKLASRRSAWPDARLEAAPSGLPRARAGGSGKAVRPSSSDTAGCPSPGPKRGAPLYGLSVPEVL